MKLQAEPLVAGEQKESFHSRRKTWPLREVRRCKLGISFFGLLLSCIKSNSDIGYPHACACQSVEGGAYINIMDQRAVAG
jgi:hypothetical protein